MAVSLGTGAGLDPTGPTGHTGVQATSRVPADDLAELPLAFQATQSLAMEVQLLRSLLHGSSPREWSERRLPAPVSEVLCRAGNVPRDAMWGPGGHDLVS